MRIFCIIRDKCSIQKRYFIRSSLGCEMGGIATFIPDVCYKFAGSTNYRCCPLEMKLRKNVASNGSRGWIKPKIDIGLSSGESRGWGIVELFFLSKLQRVVHVVIWRLGHHIR